MARAFNAHSELGVVFNPFSAFAQFSLHRCKAFALNGVSILDYVDLEQYEEPSKNDEYNIEFKEALDSIAERYRLPIELFYGQGYKVREISEIMSLPQNTIKTYLSRGRKQLAKFYGEEI